MSSRRRNKRSQVSAPEDLDCALQPDMPPRSPGIRARVKALNEEQQRYLEAIDKNQLVIGIGPAGTGKTFLSAYQAVLHHFIKANGMKRIIISRPLVEAGGEKIGYLPGDISDKIDPYLRPIYDALYEIIGIEETKNKLSKEVLEIAPLGFMRGRSFKNSFVILDEAQNASLDQLRMLITRIGHNCKVVINGDPTQTDLTGPYSKASGLMALADIVKDVPGVEVVHFTNASIVRSQLVADLIAAFDKRTSGS